MKAPNTEANALTALGEAILRMKTVKAINLVVMALGISVAFPQFAQAIPGQGTASAYNIPEDATHDGQKLQWRKQQPHLKKEHDSSQYQKNDGQDPPSDDFKSDDYKKAGMTQPKPGSNFNFVSGTPPTNAQKQNEGQSTGEQVGTLQHTLYAPNEGEYGPPKKLPFLTFPKNMNTPNVTAVPVAFSAYLPKQMYTTESDTQNAILRIAGAERAAEKIMNPEMNSIRGGFQGFTQQVADGGAAAQRGGFQAVLQTCILTLPNVANEESGTPVSGSGPRTISQAIWIVDQMYIRFYLPCALLLLLVGAVITQVGNTVKNTVAPFALMEQPDAFSGIVRGAGALVLMAMVPLIVSWGIDIGNSLTYSVTQFIQMEVITSWFDDISPDQSKQSQSQKDDQSYNETAMAASTRAIFSTVATFLNYGILVLLAYQLVIVCYLYLLGPIAAAFYAWPGGIGSLFRPVFNNWLNALTNLVLWRFWWCAILLCMVVRINWLKDIGMYDPNSAWEPLVYTAFLVMLAYVPFHALDFRPGDLVDKLLEKAKVGTKQ
jgi:hypothetical protein